MNSNVAHISVKNTTYQLEMLDLEYFGLGNRVVLFKCNWFDCDKGIKVHSWHGIIDIKHGSGLTTDEPFVLAQPAHQLYYTPYPTNRREFKDWWVVCNIKARNTYELHESHSSNDGELDATKGYFQEGEMGNPSHPTFVDVVIDSSSLYDHHATEVVNIDDVPMHSTQM